MNAQSLGKGPTFWHCKQFVVRVVLIKQGLVRVKSKREHIAQNGISAIVVLFLFSLKVIHMQINLWTAEEDISLPDIHSLHRKPPEVKSFLDECKFDLCFL